MKIHALLLGILLTLFSCIKSNEVLKDTCLKCSYSTETKKVTKEVCDDTSNSEVEKIKMEEQLQKEADALNVELNCSGS